MIFLMRLCKYPVSQSIFPQITYWLQRDRWWLSGKNMENNALAYFQSQQHEAQDMMY